MTDQTLPAPPHGTPRVCKREGCDQHVKGDRLTQGALYCSLDCKHRTQFDRWVANSRSAEWPYNKFIRATRASKRLQVDTTEKAQAQARKLIAAGMAAYENKDGLIRDVGMPKASHNAGKVFSRREEIRTKTEARSNGPQSSTLSARKGGA